VVTTTNPEAARPGPHRPATRTAPPRDRQLREDDRRGRDRGAPPM